MGPPSLTLVSLGATARDPPPPTELPCRGKAAPGLPASHAACSPSNPPPPSDRWGGVGFGSRWEGSRRAGEARPGPPVPSAAPLGGAPWDDGPAARVASHPSRPGAAPREAPRRPPAPLRGERDQAPRGRGHVDDVTLAQAHRVGRTEPRPLPSAARSLPEGAARGPAEMGAAAAEASGGARGPRVGGGGPGVCRGAARDRRAGGPGRAEPPVTAPLLPAGPARFQCPEDFCARRLAPGAAFCPESLGAPGKRLLLISAPADFRPESLSGHRLALPGSPLWRASQPDGSQKVYSLQAGREESAARLLIAAGRPERLACARPFGASLRIQERHAEPGAARALFPVAERPPPRVPEGLKQRFFPFGARLKGPRPSSEAAGKAARKRGKKRPLLPLKQALWRPEGPEQLLGGSPEPAGGLLGGWARAGRKQPLLEEEAATEPAMLPVLGGQLLWQDARPSGHLEEGSSSGEVEEPDRRRARKREKWKTGLETEELPDPSSRYWQPEQEPWWQGGREPEGDGGDCAGELAGCKAKKKKKKKTMQEAVAEELWDAAAIKEEPVDVPCQRSLPEENPRAIGEDPAGVPSCKKKKKKKSRERLAEGLWGAAAIKEELGDVPCPGNLLEEGLGSPREEPGWELAGYIKESPGKGAGGLWGIAALKEELGDAPSLGSLAQESLGVTPEDPAGELPNCKKKKKKSRERLVEGLWGVAAIKEEPRDISCLGSLLEEGLGSDRGGPAGELLACKKKKKGKLDKEPLQEQGTETQVDWATPLWQERGPEEPLQTNGAAPSPRPKKKKKGRREREDQAGLYAAGT